MAIESVLVAGASGKTGREIVSGLRPTELRVRAMTRDPERVGQLERLGADEVVIGDLVEQADADRAVSGVDAVLCAVGTRPGPAMFFGPFVDGEGVINLVDAASEAGVEHFVFESSLGVGDAKAGLPLPARLLIGRILRAKDGAESHLRGSGLPHTILRPGMLTDGPPTGEVVVGQGGDSVTGRIPRADVARLMIAAPFTPEAENRTFEVVSREGRPATPTHIAARTCVAPRGVLLGMRRYLVARDEDRDPILRHFRVDRIRAACLLGTSFVREPCFDIAAHADLKIGVVPVINLEWIQKLHRDKAARGYSIEAVTDV
ncbi:MAG: NAD(P)H-binding protein, partial [Halalkalicoccus sp.]